MIDNPSDIMHHLVHGHVTTCLTFENNGTHIYELSLIRLQKLWKLLPRERRRGGHY